MTDSFLSLAECYEVRNTVSGLFNPMNNFCVIFAPPAVCVSNFYIFWISRTPPRQPTLSLLSPWKYITVWDCGIPKYISLFCDRLKVFEVFFFLGGGDLFTSATKNDSGQYLKIPANTSLLPPSIFLQLVTHNLPTTQSKTTCTLSTDADRRIYYLTLAVICACELRPPLICGP
jgi:hypothetical protein